MYMQEHDCGNVNGELKFLGNNEYHCFIEE